MNCRDCATALADFKEALALWRRLMIAQPSIDQHAKMASACELRIGTMLCDQGDIEAGQARVQASIDLISRFLPEYIERQRADACNVMKTGDARQAEGDLFGALLCYRGSLLVWRIFVVTEPGTASDASLAECFTSIGDILMAQGDLPRALEHFGEAKSIREKLAKEDPPDTEREAFLAQIAYKVRKLAGRTRRSGAYS